MCSAVTPFLNQLHVELHHWDEAFLLAKQHPGEFREDVFLPYAEWLAINDRFEEAQEAYKQAGRPDLSRKILQQLTHNAVVERRYQDASYYYWLLALENLKMVPNEVLVPGSVPRSLVVDAVWGHTDCMLTPVPPRCISRESNGRAAGVPAQVPRVPPQGRSVLRLPLCLPIRR